MSQSRATYAIQEQWRSVFSDIFWHIHYILMVLFIVCYRPIKETLIFCCSSASPTLYSPWGWVVVQWTWFVCAAISCSLFLLQPFPPWRSDWQGAGSADWPTFTLSLQPIAHILSLLRYRGKVRPYLPHRLISTIKGQAERRVQWNRAAGVTESHPCLELSPLLKGIVLWTRLFMITRWIK